MREIKALKAPFGVNRIRHKKELKKTDCIQPSPKQILGFTCLQYKSFTNTVGKGEIARNILFSTHLEKILSYSTNLKVSSANSFSLEQFKAFRMIKR